MNSKTMRPSDARGLMDKLNRFAADPFGRHPSAEPLKGKADRVRLRQGDWRAVVLVAPAQDTVVVERIERRKEVYR